MWLPDLSRSVTTTVARAVERHGRGGLGAKGEGCHASRLGCAGDGLVGANGNCPILHRLLCGLAQTGRAGIIRSGGKVKGVALALVPVATAHGLLTLQGHARGLHAIFIGKGRRGLVVQLPYRAVFCDLVVLDRGQDAGAILGVANHGVIDRPVVCHARDPVGFLGQLLGKLVYVGTPRIRLGGIGDRRPRHRAVGVVAHGGGVVLGTLGHGSRHVCVDRIGVERCVDIHKAANALERKVKSVLGKRERPGVVGQDLLSMDDDLRFVRIVAVGEGCDLIGNLCGSRFARVVTHPLHIHARNDQCTGAVIIHLDRRGIDGSGVAYAIRPGIGAGNILRDGIGVGTRLGIGNIAKRRLRGILGELNRRHRALGTVGHGGAVLRRKLHGKGIAIGPIATFEHLLGAQTILGVELYGAGAVFVGKLEFVARRDLPVNERYNLALDGVASSRLLLAADLTAHEAKAGRKHRLFGGTGHGVDDTRQHVAIGRLALGSELAHAIAGTLLKAVYADGLAGLDGVGVAVHERERVAHSVAVRIEHMRLVALLGLRQGELKRKRQILVIRILSGCSKTSICRHRLGHLQRCHATIGILHGRCRGKEMIELECAQIGAIGGIIVLIKGHAVDARIGKDGRQLAVAVATVLDIAQDGLGTLRRLVIAHMHPVARKRRRHALGGARLAPCQVSVGVNGRTLQLALNVRKRVVDGVGRAKLRQGSNQRTRAAHAAHTVAFLAGIHIHTRIVHDYLGYGVVNLMAIRAYRLTQVVRTLGKGCMLCRIEWEACSTLNVIRIGHAVCLHGVIRRGAGFNGICAGAIAGNVLGLVQLKRRAVHGLVQVVDLLHKQAVLNVGEVDHRRELPVYRLIFDHRGVADGCLRQRRCRGVIHRHGIFRLRLVRHHGSVLLDISGQRPDRHHVVALGINIKDTRVRRFGSLDRTGNAVRGAQLIAIERVARDRRPRTFVRVFLSFIGAFEHDGEGRTRTNGFVLIVFYFFAKGNGLLGSQIAAVQPHAAARPLFVVGCCDCCLRRNHHATRATRSFLVLQMQLTWRCSSR